MSSDFLQGFSRQKNLCVSDVNALVRNALELQLDELEVEGEISNLTRASSGHLYFSLKDSRSQISCVMWRNVANLLRFSPEPGKQVKVRASISVYEPRGTYQLNCRYMEPAGEGALAAAFEKLKSKLQAEGMFDPELKKNLPLLPQRIGVVTSPTGAAIRDFLTVINRRYPNIQILIYPTLVQGDGAAEGIAKGVAVLDKLSDLDAIVVTRGGGSIEDLWAFNEEIVARAIAASKTPVISAVGHEIDFTIADFVADVRAATPSAAAEIVIGRKLDIKETLRLYQLRMQQNISGKLRQVEMSLRANSAERMLSTMQHRFQRESQRLDSLRFRSASLFGSQVQSKRQALASLASSLEALSPLQALSRGYSLITKVDSVDPVISAKELSVGDEISIKLSDGKVISSVESVDYQGEDI
jgi:exodeoxyribonuclease VII large subunit